MKNDQGMTYHGGDGSFPDDARPRRRPRLYEGEMLDGYPVVYVDGERLDPAKSQAVRNHSPDGFNWGYGGSGPSQLALAILLCEGLSPAEAEHWHQRFKADVIAALPQNETWALQGSAVGLWVKVMRKIARAAGQDVPE